MYDRSQSTDVEGFGSRQPYDSREKTFVPMIMTATTQFHVVRHGSARNFSSIFVVIIINC